MFEFRNVAGSVIKSFNDRIFYKEELENLIAEAEKIDTNKGVKLKDYAGTKRKFEHGLWDVDAQMHGEFQ